MLLSVVSFMSFEFGYVTFSLFLNALLFLEWITMFIYVIHCFALLSQISLSVMHSCDLPVCGCSVDDCQSQVIINNP